MNKKEKKKYNFIDVILIILVLLVIGAIIYAFVSPYTTQLTGNAASRKIEYRVRFEGVPDEIKYSISDGDSVTEATELVNIGKVKKTEFSSTEYVGVDKDGNSVVGICPGKKNILITVECDASVANGVYKANGYAITAGRLIDLRVPGFCGQGECVYVGEVSDNG